MPVCSLCSASEPSRREVSSRGAVHHRTPGTGVGQPVPAQSQLMPLRDGWFARQQPSSRDIDQGGVSHRMSRGDRVAPSRAQASARSQRPGIGQHAHDRLAEGGDIPDQQLSIVGDAGDVRT